MTEQENKVIDAVWDYLKVHIVEKRGTKYKIEIYIRGKKHFKRKILSRLDGYTRKGHWNKKSFLKKLWEIISTKQQLKTRKQMK
jgi:hypothetical protein